MSWENRLYLPLFLCLRTLKFPAHLLLSLKPSSLWAAGAAFPRTNWYVSYSSYGVLKEITFQKFPPRLWEKKKPVNVLLLFFFQSSFKETYMYDFFKLFQEDECIEKVKMVSISN